MQKKKPNADLPLGRAALLRTKDASARVVQPPSAVRFLRGRGAITLLAACFLFSPAAHPQASETSRMERAAADAMQRKITYVDHNGHLAKPDPRPTIFIQSEINAYFQERRLKMPEGVRSVVWTLSPGTVMARTRVDFDEITANRRADHPLLMIFSGIHDVEVVAEASGLNGIAHVRVESASIDGVNIPRRVLQMFIDRWVKPKYPNVDLENDYQMPVRINYVQIQDRKATLTQK
jgi:hypothetical protein